MTVRSNESSSDPTRNILVIRVKFFQTELMIEICYESLVRAIGKVLPMKTHKGNEKRPLFVKQIAVLVVHINNIEQ